MLNVNCDSFNVYQELALKYYYIVTKLKNPFVSEISFSKKMTIYHVGGFISEQSLRAPIFTTTDKDIAKWYGSTNIRGISSVRSSYEMVFLTTLNIKVENPLLLNPRRYFRKRLGMCYMQIFNS